MRKFGEYGAALIALYLIAAHASGMGDLIKAGANGASTVTKTFQGR